MSSHTATHGRHLISARSQDEGSCLLVNGPLFCKLDVGRLDYQSSLQRTTRAGAQTIELHCVRIEDEQPSCHGRWVTQPAHLLRAHCVYSGQLTGKKAIQEGLLKRKKKKLK